MTERLKRAEQADTQEEFDIDIPDELARREDRLAAIIQAKQEIQQRAQAAVDIESHLIVGPHVTQNANDKQEITPALQALPSSDAALGDVDALLADAGYFSEDNVRQCETAGITPYISDHRERHHLPWDERFETPSVCPDDADSVTVMAHRLRTKEGKAIYAKQKSTVETVFGIVKEAMGFRRFHLRGVDAVQGEWNLQN